VDKHQENRKIGLLKEVKCKVRKGEKGDNAATQFMSDSMLGSSEQTWPQAGETEIS